MLLNSSCYRSHIIDLQTNSNALEKGRVWTYMTCCIYFSHTVFFWLHRRKSRSSNKWDLWEWVKCVATYIGQWFSYISDGGELSPCCISELFLPPRLRCPMKDDHYFSGSEEMRHRDDHFPPRWAEPIQGSPGMGQILWGEKWIKCDPSCFPAPAPLVSLTLWTRTGVASSSPYSFNSLFIASCSFLVMRWGAIWIA